MKYFINCKAFRELHPLPKPKLIRPALRFEFVMLPIKDEELANTIAGLTNKITGDDVRVTKVGYNCFDVFRFTGSDWVKA